METFESPLAMTRHASHRSASRCIPLWVIDLILAYGDSRDAGEGARKFALTKAGLRQIRRELGAETAHRIARFRFAYIVAAAGRIITAAFAAHPLFQ